MPRPPRCLQRDYWYHLLNRGNGKARIFHDAWDYSAFLKRLATVPALHEVETVAFCIMPNHFHLVMRGGAIGSLSRAMHRMQTSYAARYRTRYGSVGHVLQGRFRSFPIQDGDHLLTVMRYVERNPVRANLVGSAEAWSWSSVRWRERDVAWLADPPMSLGDDWLEYVNAPQTPAEMNAVRNSIERGAPFGEAVWRTDTARALGLESTLRSRGRPPTPN